MRLLGARPAMTALAAFEEIIDASGAAPRIEAMLPAGVRPRQLSVRTLLAGMCLTQADHRPAHLTRVHQALTSLPEDEQRRLGVIADWKHGPHQLTYRQTERTFGLVTAALGKDQPDGLPSGAAGGLRRPARSEHPGPVHRRQHVAGRGLDGPGILLPAPAAPAPAAAPTPKPPGATARTTCCAAKTSCSTATTCPPAS